jgi:hypothetical protein
MALSESEKTRRRERRRLWREENREEYRAQQRASYQRRKDSLALKRMDPDAKETKRLYDKGYREVNGATLRMKGGEYYRANKPAIIARVTRNSRKRRGYDDDGFNQ